jgi:hypothetical protein
MHEVFAHTNLIKITCSTLGPKKKICVFTVTCQKNLGSVGRDSFFFFFLLLSTKPEIVVPGSGIRFRLKHMDYTSEVSHIN